MFNRANLLVVLIAIAGGLLGLFVGSYFNRPHVAGMPAGAGVLAPGDALALLPRERLGFLIFQAVFYWAGWAVLSLLLLPGLGAIGVALAVTSETVEATGTPTLIVSPWCSNSRTRSAASCDPDSMKATSAEVASTANADCSTIIPTKSGTLGKMRPTTLDRGLLAPPLMSCLLVDRLADRGS